MKKYGLQLRVPPSQQKKPAAGRPPLAAPAAFRDNDDDDVEREISRQASKNKALKDIEEQHKKALEEDPSAFDYDGVYDQMKEKIVQPRAQDRQERKPKYIVNLMKKAEERQREHEIVYERKLAKERSKEDHLYANKDKFVTSAYKKKLAEQAKWMEEERLRQLKEEKDEVTKKTDMTDFYFNLEKNVAFGAKGSELKKTEKQVEVRKPEEHEETVIADQSDKGRSMSNSNSPSESSRSKEGHQGESSTLLKRNFESSDAKPVSDTSEKPSPEPPSTDQPKRDHHKRSEDAVAAAKERFMARKRTKE